MQENWLSGTTERLQNRGESTTSIINARIKIRIVLNELKKFSIFVQASLTHSQEFLAKVLTLKKVELNSALSSLIKKFESLLIGDLSNISRI